MKHEAINQRRIVTGKRRPGLWHICLAALSLLMLTPAMAAGAPDLAYGAYQRGLYQTAVALALARLKQHSADAPAMALIGRIYAEGYAFGPHPKQSASWYRLAAKQGNSAAQFAWGMDLLEGFGTPKNPADGKRWLTRSAGLGNADAQYNLGVLTLAQGKGAIGSTTFAKAASWFRQAASGGNADAALSLGLLYQAGRGVPKDLTRAAQWFLMAARRDNAPGMVEFGLAQFKGTGITKNELGGANWLLKAANLDNPIAEDRVARLYAVGRALPLDRVAALKWHVLAKAAGVQDAWLDNELRSTSPQEKTAAARQLHDYLNP